LGCRTTLAERWAAPDDCRKEDELMSVQVIVGGAVYTISGADRLQVDGALVQIQRSSPMGYETIAVAGDELLVTIGPAACTRVQTEAPGVGAQPETPPRRPETRPEGGPPVWYPVGGLMDPLD
jgi:hypothetical protein